MTDAAWTMEVLLSHRVPRDLHAQLDPRAINVTSLLFYTRYRGTPPSFTTPLFSPPAPRQLSSRGRRLWAIFHEVDNALLRSARGSI